MEKFENEIWKPIKGYEGLYEVSNYGRVKALDRAVWVNKYNGYYAHFKGHILPQHNCLGYRIVKLCKNGTKRHPRVHQLVAEAFIPNPNPEEFDQVNHKDEDKTNNIVSNLEWCDSKYNNSYGTKIQRSLVTKKEKGSSNAEKRIEQYNLDGELLATYPSIAEASRCTGMARISIRRHLQCKVIKPYKFIWKEVA